MKVLLAHNYYGASAPSGENHVFELEQSLLRTRGHEVTTYVRYSDDIRKAGLWGLLRGAIATPWNPATARDIRKLIARSRPDVVHVHNSFPLISPSVFAAVGERAARVLTVHNYRLVCPAAIPLRDGKPCTECIDRRSVIPAVRHGCYRDSRLATLPIAAGVALHRFIRTWSRQVDAFIVLTEFQRAYMAAAGAPPDRIWVKPNFYPGNPDVVPWSRRRERIVFAGRLTVEKGVVPLIHAWCSWGEAAPELRIVGDGPLRASLESTARAGRANITFLGQLPPNGAESEIANARLLLLPSVWFETFGLVLREAFALGTPAGVSEIGPLPTIVQHGRTGVVFKPNDAGALLRAVRDLWHRQDVLAAMSMAARMEFEAKYAEQANYEQLLQVYSKAIAVQKGRSRA